MLSVFGRKQTFFSGHRRFILGLPEAVVTNASTGGVQTKLLFIVIKAHTSTVELVKEGGVQHFREGLLPIFLEPEQKNA